MVAALATPAAKTAEQVREVAAEVLSAAGVSELTFGKEYVIPKPMDARLLPRVARAVALAAVASGVARIALPADYMQD